MASVRCLVRLVVVAVVVRLVRAVAAVQVHAVSLGDGDNAGVIIPGDRGITEAF